MLFYCLFVVGSGFRQRAVEGMLASEVNAVVMSGAGVPSSKTGAVRRHGKKMMVCELKQQASSLLENNLILQKELEVHKMSKLMLIDENKRLKRLQEKLQHQVVAEPRVEGQLLEVKPNGCFRFPFDLNLPFPEESEFMVN